MEKKYIIFNLCGDKPKTVTEAELKEMHEENPYLFGYHGCEIIGNALDPNYNDWTEIVFLVEENIVMPDNVSAQTIFDFVASWCVNVAFGGMDCYDSKMTVKDFAEALDILDENKATEFRKIANRNYFLAQFADLSWDAFMNQEPIDDDELVARGVDLTDAQAVEDATDKINAAVEDYNIDSYLRELNPPFDYDNDEVRNLLFDALSGELSKEHYWK